MWLSLQTDFSGSSPATSQSPSGQQNQSVWQHIPAALHHAAWRVADVLVSLLSGVVALLLALALCTALGFVLSWVLRRGLGAARFDERLKRSGAVDLADWSPNRSPTALVGRAAFWGCVLIGLLVGVSALDALYATGFPLAVPLMPYLTHTVGAIVLLLAGNLLARYLARAVILGAVQRNIGHARALSLGVKWMVLVTAAAMALEHLGVGGTVVELAFGLLFGGIVLTLALGVGLGSRRFVARTLAAAETPFQRAPFRRGEDTESIRHF